MLVLEASIRVSCVYPGQPMKRTRMPSKAIDSTAARGDGGALSRSLAPRCPRQRVSDDDTEDTPKPGSYPADEILLQLHRRPQKPREMPPLLAERRRPSGCVGVHVERDDLFGCTEFRGYGIPGTQY